MTESAVVPDSHIPGYPDTVPTNLPMADARAEIFATDRVNSTRMVAAKYVRTVADDAIHGLFGA